MNGMMRGTAFVGSERRSIGQALLPYLPPWVVGALLWPAALLGHVMWGTDPMALPWVTSAMTLVAAALTFLTAKTASGKAGKRAHATCTVGGALLWLIAAVIAHPGTHPLIDIWLLGTPAMAVSWNLRRWARSDKNENESDGESDLFKKVKLAGTKTKQITAGPNKVKADLQLPPGELTPEDVVKAQPRLASALSVPANSVRINPDKDHHDRATMTVVPNDVLRHPAEWPGPAELGTSIMDPVIPGLYEDGEPAQLWFPGDKTQARNATHMIVMGMSGAGKSHGAKIVWTDLLTRSDAVLWVADPQKGKQTLRTFLPHLDWAASNKDQAKQMINVIPDVVRARADKLGELGYDEWEPGCGLPYLVVWVEEAPDLVRDSDEMVLAAQTARSAGVSLVLSLQRADNANMDVNIRAQVGTTWCYGVKAINDATFAMSDELVEAGANPAAWKNTKPGYSYLEAPGIDEERMLMPLRTFKIDESKMDEIIRMAAPVRPQLDATTVAAAGKAYANRPQHAEGDTTPAATVDAANTQDDQAFDDVDQADDEVPKPARDPFRGRLSSADDQAELDLPEDPEPDLLGDADAELPAVAHIEFPERKPSTAEARRLLLDVLIELQAQGAATVGPKDIPDAFTDQVRSRPWVSLQLKGFAAKGVLTDTDRSGVYLFPPEFPETGLADAA